MVGDYISREELYKTVLSAFITAERCGFDLGKDVVLLAIEQQPAADVVEVVRCRDCVFGNMPCAMARYPDYFCADGKRKDGGQEPPKEEE